MGTMVRWLYFTLVVLRAFYLYSKSGPLLLFFAPTYVLWARQKELLDLLHQLRIDGGGGCSGGGGDGGGYGDGDGGGDGEAAPRRDEGELFSACLSEIVQRCDISPRMCIVSLGGAVVVRTCTALAAVLCGGVALVHMPTTLQAALGAAVDLRPAPGRQLACAYHPAAHVVVDPSVLADAARSCQSIRSGLAEALKYGLCISSPLVEDVTAPLQKYGLEVCRKEAYLMYVACLLFDVKLTHLYCDAQADASDGVTYYGHALGTVIERLSQRMMPSRTLFAGEAHAIGMCLCAEVAKLGGLCDGHVVDDHYRVFSTAALPTFVPSGMDEEAMLRQAEEHRSVAADSIPSFCSQVGKTAIRRPSHALLMNRVLLREALLANTRRRDAATIVVRLT
eukprot:NODE_814_length_1354_cov_299.358737.p1 GENE.NODE_814_length_1354_cov_299.358737~~NODE_814_length_1354_cov_299.358737.p1  ORF type:complete len:393 (+),score=124.83 NODE_814_length_1354_cov_299.358737:3-1181(+)